MFLRVSVITEVAHYKMPLLRMPRERLRDVRNIMTAEDYKFFMRLDMVRIF